MGDVYDYTVLGRRVREVRGEKQITQCKLSKETGLSQCFLSHLENGQRQATTQTLCSLSNALDCTPNDLLSIPADAASPGVTITSTYIEIRKREAAEEENKN
jgi:transcriptional regulator with XRE-family HTH domain